MLYVAFIFSILCSVGLPILAIILFVKFNSGTGKAIVFGVLAFFISQILLRAPLLQVLGSIWPTYATWLNNPNFMYCLFLGITAGLFEEGARYLFMVIFLKKQRTDVDGIAFGIGHGGIEAILLVGINAIIIFLSLVLGSGGIYQTISATGVFLGGGERIFAMIFHVAWSLMVMKSIQQKKLILLFAAFLSHAFLDTVVVYMVIVGLNVFAIESLLAVFTIFPVLYIVFVCRKDKKENPQIFKRIEEEYGNE